MGKENSVVTNKKSFVLTPDDLANGILDCLDEDKYSGSLPRHFKEFRQVLNFLLCFDGNRQRGNTNAETGEPALVAYSFFLSGNTTFPYNWSYLLKKNGEFAAFRQRFADYITLLTKDLTSILSQLQKNIHLTINIDGYLTIAICKEEEEIHLTCNINFDKIPQLYTIKKDRYQLNLSADNDIIGTYKRETENDIFAIIGDIAEYYKSKNPVKSNENEEN